MADNSDEGGPHLDEENEEGGPVKSFLEHLEDFRWTLIKCLTVTGISMVLCLIAGNVLINVLKWPLRHQPLLNFSTAPPRLALLVGTNELGSFNLTTNSIPGLPLASQGTTVLELMPLQVGTNQIWAFGFSTNAAAYLESKPLVDITILGPMEAFFVSLKVSLYGGLLLASPFVLFFIGQFVLPALKAKEKQIFFRGFSIGSVLFVAGCAFCYFVLLPMSLNLAVKYATWMGFTSTQFRAGEYIGVVCLFILAMGLAFQLPVILLTLVKIGIVSYSALAGFRRYMVVVNLVVAGILTPPEPVSQVLMFIPMQLLYEASVLVAWYWDRRDRRKAEQAEGANYKKELSGT